VYPVGRLDFGTSGVLLATNDGAFADALLHPRKAVPKTYVVKVAGTMTDGDVERWRQGVMLDDGKTLPADVSLIRYEAGEAADERPAARDTSARAERARAARGKTWLEVTIREGRNQQIRRMGEATGFPVMRLARVSFAGVTSEGMRPGAVRSLVRAELALLKKTYGVPKSIPSEMEAHESRARPRPAWRGKREAAGEAAQAESASPRYGMGAPGRRSHEVKEDYGGRSGRGSSGPTREEEASPPPRGGLGGGRFAPTRTTGTGGGIGAGEGSYRRGRGRTRR
jgi:23S rRNA pseudouridine2605 synthase